MTCCELLGEALKVLVSLTKLHVLPITLDGATYWIISLINILLDWVICTHNLSILHNPMDKQ